LFAAVIARVWRAFPIADIATAVEALADPAVGLARIGHAVAEFWAPSMAVAFLRMVISEAPRFPDLAQRFSEAGKAPAMRAVTGYLAEVAQRGALAIDDVDLAARQFLGLVNEPLLWHRVIGLDEDASKAKRERVVECAVAVFLSYYLPTRTPRTTKRKQSR
jgi:hypothetical protein